MIIIILIILIIIIIIIVIMIMIILTHSKYFTVFDWMQGRRLILEKQMALTKYGRRGRLGNEVDR